MPKPIERETFPIFSLVVHHGALVHHKIHKFQRNHATWRHFHLWRFVRMLPASLQQHALGFPEAIPAKRAAKTLDGTDMHMWKNGEKMTLIVAVFKIPGTEILSAGVDTKLTLSWHQTCRNLPKKTLGKFACHGMTSWRRLFWKNSGTARAMWSSMT